MNTVPEDLGFGQVMKEVPLDPNVILSAEFEYAAQAAFQANEDRIKVFSYYLATAGTLFAAVVLLDIDRAEHLGILSLLLGGLVALGVSSFLQLAKLRLAWIDSVRAMSRIKQHYIEVLHDTAFARSFHWGSETIPPADKKWTIAFLVALTMAFINSVSLGGMVTMFSLVIGGDLWWIQGSAVGILALMTHLVIWSCVCRER
jgi:hypothetical protein